MNYWQNRLLRLQQMGFEPGAILDIGAHEGTWTYGARRVFDDSHFLLIEANPSHEPILRDYTASDPELDFVIGLLGDRRRPQVDFYWSTSDSSVGNSIYIEQTNNPFKKISLPMVRLDDLLASREPRDYQLIKLDVQGAELDVLRGGINALTKAEFVLLEASVVQYNVGAPLLHEVIGFMHDSGFTVQDVLEMGFTPNKERILCQLDLLFARETSPFVKRGILF